MVHAAIVPQLVHPSRGSERLYLRFLFGHQAIEQDPQAAFEVAFTIENLAKTFENLKESKRDRITRHIGIATGWDGISLSDFERQRDSHLTAISRKALDGRYTFRPSLYRDVPKTDGSGDRRICYSGIRDSITQRALYQVLSPVIDRLLTPAAFAYRSGLDTHGAVKTVFDAAQAGKPWIFESDLEKFFNTLSHERLQSLVADLPIDPRARTLIWRFMRTGEVPAGEGKSSMPDVRRVGVPQGGVLSGALANLYLVEFDNAIQATGHKLVRYADDLIVLSADQETCHDVQDLAEKQAAAIGLKLHPRKTRIAHINEGVDFLGFRIRGTLVSVRQANVRKFKHRIRSIVAESDEEITAGTRQACKAELRRLVWKLKSKVEGVIEGDEHRSWINYFRIVNDVPQLRQLDRFIVNELRRWCRRHLRTDVSRTELRRLGHRFLVTEYWRVRRKPTRRLVFRGFVSTAMELTIPASPSEVPTSTIAQSMTDV